MSLSRPAAPGAIHDQHHHRRCPAARQPSTRAHGRFSATYTWPERQQRSPRADSHRSDHARRLVCAAGKARAAEAYMTDAEEEEEDAIGPAFRATLDMLEWPRICEQLADFASTQCGKRACLGLSIPRTQRESEKLLVDTTCVARLHHLVCTRLWWMHRLRQRALQHLAAAAQAKPQPRARRPRRRAQPRQQPAQQPALPLP
jgi:hypothetical protein